MHAERVIRGIGYWQKKSWSRWSVWRLGSCERTRATKMLMLPRFSASIQSVARGNCAPCTKSSTALISRSLIGSIVPGSPLKLRCLIEEHRWGFPNSFRSSEWIEGLPDDGFWGSVFHVQPMALHREQSEKSPIVKSSSFNAANCRILSESSKGTDLMLLLWSAQAPDDGDGDGFNVCWCSSCVSD